MGSRNELRTMTMDTSSIKYDGEQILNSYKLTYV